MATRHSVLVPVVLEPQQMPFSENSDHRFSDTVEDTIASIREVACHPINTAILIQGCVMLACLILGWIWAARNRRRELQRTLSEAAKKRVATGGMTSSPPRTKAEGCFHELPGVSVVLPVKGIHERTLENWKSLLTTDYAGDLQFCFVVETLDDPAALLFQGLESEKAGRMFQLVEAGASVTCSQKIFSMQAGVAACPGMSKYVLFLDDDIELHPGSIEELVNSMEQDSQVFVATGYPLDVVVPESSFAAYLMMVYHMPLLIAFSHGKYAMHLWGGCMMVRLEDLREDKYGAMSAWRDGGYSDDLLLASICGANKRSIACPARAIFPNYISPTTTFPMYWNYLRRQLYVLYTWSSTYNCMVNQTLLYAHIYVSMGITLPFFIAMLHLVLLITELLLLPMRHVYKGPGAALPWLEAPDCPLGGISMMGYLFMVYLAGWAMRGMCVASADLCDALTSPGRPSPIPTLPMRHTKWHLVVAAFLTANFILPLCALITGVRSEVEWTGVTYAKSGGRVKPIRRGEV